MEGENLCILAGLSIRFDSEEIPSYFAAACAELNINVLPEGDAWAEALMVRHAVVSGTYSARDAIEHLASLFVNSEYSAEEFSPWYNMNEEIDFTASEFAGTFYDPVQLVNLETAFETEWKLLERFRSLGGRIPLRGRFFCQTCESSADYHPAPIGLWGRIRKQFLPRIHLATHPHSCPHCGSKSSQPLDSPEARAAYYETLESRAEDKQADLEPDNESGEPSAFRH